MPSDERHGDEGAQEAWDTLMRHFGCGCPKCGDPQGMLGTVSCRQCGHIPEEVRAMSEQQGDGVAHNSSSDLPTIEFVTESGAHRRIAYERVGENQRVVRRVSHYDGDGWRPVGQEELRPLEIDGEARMPVNLRVTGDN